MDYTKYLEQMKSIQKCILEYIENDSNEEDNYARFIKILNDQKIHESKYMIKVIMHLILNISNNHNRNTSFFKKIDKLISAFEEDMKKYFSNYEIFNTFKGNKRILFFLLEEKILIPDRSIAITITEEKYKDAQYHYYFFPEFKAYFDENLLNEIYETKPELFQNDEISDIEKFNKNRQNGENENEVCRLIRENLLDEFIEFVHENKSILTFEIEPSVFETNQFLIDKKPTLIEYAAFFGSFKIFKYLYLIDTKLESSLWLYSIHGNTKDTLHLLKDKFVKPKDTSYLECLIESIKCHHLKISKNFLKADILKNVNFYQKAIKFFNFEFFPIDLNEDDDIFYILCQYDYYSIVDFLLKTTDIDINSIQILNN